MLFCISLEHKLFFHYSINNPFVKINTLKLLKYPLLFTLALSIGLIIGSINAYYEFSYSFYFLLLIFYVVLVSVFATLVTLERKKNTKRIAWTKFLLTFVGWSALIIILLVIIISLFV